MKNFKKILLLALSVLMIFAMCACDGGNEGADETTVAETAPETKPETTVAPADDMITYIVKVTDESGAPISGAMVQMCKDACVPGRTNDEGIAEFSLVEDEYKASFLFVPEGYALQDENVTDFYFEEGATEITLVLKAIG